MSAVGPGDLLEAIETHAYTLSGIEAGRIYVVTDVVPPDLLQAGACAHGPQCRNPGVHLREAPLSPFWFWCLASFKPVGRPARHIIRAFTTSDRVSA